MIAHETPVTLEGYVIFQNDDAELFDSGIVSSIPRPREFKHSGIMSFKTYATAVTPVALVMAPLKSTLNMAAPSRPHARENELDDAACSGLTFHEDYQVNGESSVEDSLELSEPEYELDILVLPPVKIISEVDVDDIEYVDIKLNPLL